MPEGAHKDTLKNEFIDGALSIKTGWIATVNFLKSVIIINENKYPIWPIGKAAQELIIIGGLENWVKERI